MTQDNPENEHEFHGEVIVALTEKQALLLDLMKHAPSPVPEWFVAKGMNNDPDRYKTKPCDEFDAYRDKLKEEIYMQWPLYFATEQLKRRNQGE